MVYKIKKYLFILTALLIAVNANSQNRTDSVSFNHSDLNGGATSKPLLIGFDKCSGLSYQYNSVKLYNYFHLGEDYKYGTATNSASVIIQVELYNTPSGSTGLMKTFTSTAVVINQDAPEKEYILDITPYVKTGAIRALITTSSYSCSSPYQSRIKLASFYKEDVGVDVRGKSVTSGTPTIANPVKFIWSRNATQQCIPNYQIQILRLFNKELAKGDNEIKLNDSVKWGRALTIETGNSDTTISLTLTEGRGYYTWRVRPIGTIYPGGSANWRNWGNWNSTSLAEGTNVNFTSNSYASSILFFYYQFNDDKNWIYSRTFSEGDPLNTKVRMSETMNWANGLQQVKQQQVKQQSANMVVANQTIYDYSSRPAVTTLPAPILRDTLGYYPGFMKVGSTLYGAQYFDADTTYTTPRAANAGQLFLYYSNSSNSNGGDSLVPNSEGYPYSRNLYERDGTGRIKEQGAPGETGRIKSSNDHTNKTLSAGVSDQELIRIFGDEAPEAKSVYKTLNIDPNKTATISYMSKEGQTIATAISIGADSIGSTLDTLPGYKKSVITIKDTMHGNSPFGKYGITSNKPFVFAVPTTVSFKYTIKEKDIKQLCMNYCSTCDYTIQFLLHTDDTTYVIANKLIGAGACSLPPTKWDTTFTKLLDAGKKYVFEKRVFANNVKPGVTPVTTYLDIHTDSIRNTLQRRADDSLAIVYGFLKRNSMDSLYRYLNHGTFVNFAVNNADSVFIDSSFVKSIGCMNINIPITFCEKDICPGDFEKYFNDRWKGKYDDSPGTTYLDFLVPPYGQGSFRFQKGQFNRLIKNMIDSAGYNCQNLWDCWKQVTQNYGNLKQLADTGNTGYKLDAFEEFMRCTGRKYKGWSSNTSDTLKFLNKAYAYFYKAASTNDCDSLMKHAYGSVGGWAQDSLDVINPANKKWESYYNCVRYTVRAASNDINLSKNTAEGGCEAACNSRYAAFKRSIINMYHNDSIYIEGDKFKLKKDTIWGQIYGLNTDTLSSAPDPTYFRSMSSVECMAHTMLESCISNCTLTLYDTLGGKKAGTAAQLEAVKQAMTWSFEVKRTANGTSCGAGWKKLGPKFNLDAASDDTVSVLWQKHYGGNSTDILTDMLEIKNYGGALLAGYTTTGQDNDISTASKGSDDYWIARINDKGDIMWEKRFGGSVVDQLSTMIETSDGGFLLGGTSASGATGDKSDASRGGKDYWIIKLDPLGNILWNEAYGGSGDDVLTSVTETKDGKFVLGGYSTSGIGGEKSQALKGLTDYWVIKTTSKGQKIWDKTFGSDFGVQSYADVINTVKETNDGNYMLGGTTASVQIGGDKTQAGSAGFNYWIIKIDTAGTKIWDKTYGGSGSDQLRDLLQKPSGDYILVGYSDSNISGNKTQNSYGGSDIWALQINDRNWPSNGDTVRWDKTYGGSSSEGANFDNVSIQRVTGKQQYVIVASSASGISGNKTQSTFGNADFWAVKIDTIGTKVWDHRWGGTAEDGMCALTADQEGYVWYAGYSASNNNGNKTVPFYNASIDYWVLRTRDACTHDSVCFRWINTPQNFPPDSNTVEFKYLTCDSVNSEFVYNSILLQVQKYIDSSVTDYQIKYVITCASADSVKDTLSLSYPQGYYNYTLYYYDRAGNLVRTVPPAGVNYNDSLGVLVTKRSQHNYHSFVTKYKYNSLKQLVQQQTPDGGISYFWYDYKGELRVSQNAKQKAANKYSYTKYDNLGRITEVGQSSDSISTFFKTWNLNNVNFPVNNNAERTYTVYTTAATNIYYIGNKIQRYLQNRVSYTYTDDNVYTYYSYDPHGNVEWLIQELPGLGKNYIRYEYDLISNKVLAVHYNEGAADEYHHRYMYDTDQRLLNAQTAWGPGAISSSSSLQPQPAVVKQNNVGWDNDAKYKYFPHGPLKRAEIGEDHIQGLDYVYTINGWLKAINYPTFSPGDDPGKDNDKTFSADAFTMVLGYHDNDFNRTGSKYNPSNAKLVSSTSTSAGQPGVNLYNGNITNWTIRTDSIGLNFAGNMGFKYKYDQLNRIKTEDYRLRTGGSWTDPANSFDNRYTYDGNGNILTLNRKGDANNMDSLIYNYPTAGTNKLGHVDDAVSSIYSTDIDDQSAGNYTYDAIGNLISDAQSTIDNINWTVYGKIKSIKKSNNDSIIFTYDAAGNRVMKTNKPNSGTPTVTYYIKDASGNALSVYDRTTNGVNYEYRIKEQTIYGSSRLGIKTPNVLIKTLRTDGTSQSCLSCAKYYWTIDAQNANGYYTRALTKKIYELSDHLGNVRVTVSDRKQTDSTAQLLSYDNYYSFGSEMPNKSYTPNNYRYGFNGKEKDDEVKGMSGSQYDYGMRIYDSRLGRFLSEDPITAKYPELTPYQFASNSPIWGIDWDGLELRIYTSTKGLTGHTFFTVGKGKDLVVYSYGQYGKPKYSLFGGYSPEGQGVLNRYNGLRAKKFIKQYVKYEGAKVYEIKDADENKARENLDAKWKAGKLATEGKAKDDIDARVINDTYGLFSDNCATLTSDETKAAGSKLKFETKKEMYVSGSSVPGIPGQVLEYNDKVNTPKEMESYLSNQAKQKDSPVKDVTPEVSKEVEQK
jgi:RHS repeat-associated protein